MVSFCGDVYTIEDFCANIDCGMFNSFDGYGYYSKDGEDEYETVSFDVTQIRKVSDRKGYKYIIWYNK